MQIYFSTANAANTTPVEITDPSEEPRTWPRPSTFHPISNFVSHHRLSSLCCQFLASICSIFVPQSYHEALRHPGWKAAMEEEMHGLYEIQTWPLFLFLPARNLWVVNAFLISNIIQMVLLLASKSDSLPRDPINFGFDWCLVDHYVFINITLKWKLLLLLYVDDIVLTGSDADNVKETKYVLDLLEDTRMMGIRPTDTLVDANVKLCASSTEDVDIALERILRYLKRAQGKWFLYKNYGHYNIDGFLDADQVGSPYDRKPTSGYCTLVGESEYIAMAHTTNELIRIKSFFIELGFYKGALWNYIVTTKQPFISLQILSSMR
ncbi:uncharacterized protein [Aristolochia californica]|uniref:uncharacterized protein n=1 Tax=Aristolochia californica TaxID=171875 RepID=UPI0035E18254